MNPRPRFRRKFAAAVAETSLVCLSLMAGGEALRGESASGHLPDFSAVKVELNGVFTPDLNKKPERPGTGMATVSMGLFDYGLPARFVVGVDRVQAILQTRNGEALALTMKPGPVPLAKPDVPAVQAALGDVRLFAADEYPFAIVPLFSLERDVLKKHWSDRLRFSATLDLRVAEYAAEERLALRDARFARAADDSLIVKAGKARPSEFPLETAGETVAVLQNSGRKQALLGWPSFEVDADSGVPRFAGWGFSGKDAPAGTLLTTDWLTGAEIVVFKLRPIASLQRTFSRDPFQLSFDIPGQRGKTSDYDGRSLAGITLPASPTRQQVRAYVDAILAVSKKQKNLGYEDPQVGMLMKVGPENLDVLIEAAPVPRTWKDVHIWKAMRGLVEHAPTDRQRDLILAKLAEKPELAELLQEPPWREAARTILLKGLQDGRDDLTAEWIGAIIDFRDPQTYPALAAYYARNPTQPGLYEKIRTVPGIDLQPMMEKAWATAKKGDVRQQSFVIHPACEWGVADALATAASWIQSPNDYPRRVGRTVLRKFTPAEGDDAALRAWYEAHKGSLVFDRDRKMFLPGP